jgi:hypothetical protein
MQISTTQRHSKAAFTEKSYIIKMLWSREALPQGWHARMTVSQIVQGNRVLRSGEMAEWLKAAVC